MFFSIAVALLASKYMKDAPAYDIRIIQSDYLRALLVQHETAIREVFSLIVCQEVSDLDWCRSQLLAPLSGLCLASMPHVWPLGSPRRIVCRELGRATDTTVAAGPATAALARLRKAGIMVNTTDSRDQFS